MFGQVEAEDDVFGRLEPRMTLDRSKPRDGASGRFGAWSDAFCDAGVWDGIFGDKSRG